MRFVPGLVLLATSVSAQQIVIKSSRLLDGKGGQLQNATIVIDGSKILSVGPSSAKVTYDLSGLTVMPGWIDTHVHIGQHLNRDGRADRAKRRPRKSLCSAPATCTRR